MPGEGSASSPPLLRLAFVGKGGSGKSVIAGTLARLLAADGEPVLVLDSDPLPGLAFSLGMALVDAGIPDDAVVEQPDGGPGPRFRLCEDAITTVERYARRGPDGLRALQLGKPAGHPGAGPTRSQAAFRQTIADLATSPWHVIGDLPGGTRQPFFGWARWATLVVVVTEPSAGSILSARRLARLGAEPDGPRVAAIASKVERSDDDRLVAERTRLPLLASVPLDPSVAAAERRGEAPIDHDPHSPAVQAIRSLLAQVREAGGAG